MKFNCSNMLKCQQLLFTFEPRYEKTGFLHMRKTKMQISFAVTAKLISAFVFATWIVQSLYFLNPKFQASSHLVWLWLHSLVCVGPGRKPWRPDFSERGSFGFIAGICFTVSIWHQKLKEFLMIKKFFTKWKLRLHTIILYLKFFVVNLGSTPHREYLCCWPGWVGNIEKQFSTRPQGYKTFSCST